MQCQSLFVEVKFYHPVRLISTTSCSNAHHACTMSNITLGNVASLYFSCRFARKNVESTWQDATNQRFVRQIARRQFLPLETIAPTVASWKESKGVASHYKFSASHQTSDGAVETTAFY